jgi:CRP-like cAMP-binding protein
MVSNCPLFNSLFHGIRTKRKGANMSVTTILKGHEFFSHLRVEDVDKISRFAESKVSEPGDFIFKHGEKAEKVFLLLEGSVHLGLPAKPEEFLVLVSKVEKGDLFGLSSLLGSDRHILAAQCLEKSEVLVIDAKKLRNLLESDCIIGFFIMSEVARAHYDRYIALLNRLQSIVLQIPLIS